VEPRGKRAADRFYGIGSKEEIGDGSLPTCVTGNTLGGVRCLRQ